MLLVSPKKYLKKVERWTTIMKLLWKGPLGVVKKTQSICSLPLRKLVDFH
uniref:Uncharacterized protein n=1 Tax=Rhizophora mucronata TaxID=61149 RepID=A0A2P2PTF8_RHIMU